MALKPGARLGVGDQADLHSAGQTARNAVGCVLVVLCLVSAEDTLESHYWGRAMNCIGSRRSRFCNRLLELAN